LSIRPSPRRMTFGVNPVFPTPLASFIALNTGGDNRRKGQGSTAQHQLPP
jgi:hypothetical protein